MVDKFDRVGGTRSEEVQSDLSAFVSLQERDVRLVQRFWTNARPRAPELISEFYTVLVKIPAMQALLGSRTDSLARAQLQHWDRLFTGKLDDDYRAGVAAIARAHARIGLRPDWYMAGYGWLLARMSALAVELGGWRRRRTSATVRALTELVAFDMAQAVGAYDDLEDERRRASQEMRAQVAAKVAQQIAATNGVVHRVSQATSDLDAAIRDIGSQSLRSSEELSQAADQAEQIQRLMAELEAAAKEIDGVVSMISDVAEQTNLLALNATIEASRAGSAGKGFAVVANEVKALAVQTTRSSKEISHRIRHMQAQVDASSRAVDEVADRLSAISSSEASIAAGVEQLVGSSRTIQGQVAAVASQTDLIAECMEEVCHSTPAPTPAKQLEAEFLEAAQ